MEKRLYIDRRTLYINDKPVSGHYFGNVRYGEPITHDIPIVDFEDLYNTAGSSDIWHLSIKFCRGFKKIKLGGRSSTKKMLRISVS